MDHEQAQDEVASPLPEPAGEPLLEGEEEFRANARVGAARLTPTPPPGKE